MTQNKTQATDADVSALIDAIDHPRRRADAKTLLALFQRVTGYEPVIWGPAIVGFGAYHYRYDSGREGDFLATGFAVRARSLVIYIMPGYAEFGPILDRLGKYKKGKSCLYINKLDDIDLDVLEELVRQGLADLNARRPVTAS